MVNTSGLEEKVRVRAAEKMTAASDEMRRQIEHDAPRDTGQLSVAPVTSTTVSDRQIVSHVTVNRESPSGFDIATAQEEGTGIYAGRGRIYPTNHKYLKFYWSKFGVTIYAKSVAGSPATHFFSNAVAKWKDLLSEAYGR